jgi:hypothetical protein
MHIIELQNVYNGPSLRFWQKILTQSKEQEITIAI